MDKNWKPYNPQWLIELASTQLPDNHKIIDTLSNCTRAKQESRAYICFVNGENLNQNGNLTKTSYLRIKGKVQL